MDPIKLVLTDSKTIPTFKQRNVCISPKGSLIFTTYTQGPLFATSSDLNKAAEIFQNNDGTLESIKTISMEDRFPNILMGTSNLDFSKFVILADDNDSTGCVKLYNRDGSLISSYEIKNYPVKTRSLLITNAGFSHDSRYIVITYIQQTSFGITSRLEILESYTLNRIVERYLPGVSTGASFITRKDKSGRLEFYVSVGIQGISIDFSVENSSSGVPKIIIYRFHPELPELSFIDEALTPQAPHVYIYNSQRRSRILIGATTNLITPPNQINIYNEHRTSWLEDDYYNFRLYDFNGIKLRLISRRQLPSDCGNIAFYPNRHFIALSQNVGYFNFGISPYVCMLYAIQPSTDKKHIYMKPYCESLIIPTSEPSLSFSKNGKWMIIGGSSENSNIANLHLYKVKRIIDLSMQNMRSVEIPSIQPSKSGSHRHSNSKSDIVNVESISEKKHKHSKKNNTHSKNENTKSKQSSLNTENPLRIIQSSQSNEPNEPMTLDQQIKNAIRNQLNHLPIKGRPEIINGKQYPNVIRIKWSRDTDDEDEDDDDDDDNSEDNNEKDSDNSEENKEEDTDNILHIKLNQTKPSHPTPTPRPTNGPPPKPKPTAILKPIPKPIPKPESKIITSLTALKDVAHQVPDKQNENTLASSVNINSSTNRVYESENSKKNESTKESKTRVRFEHPDSDDSYSDDDSDDNAISVIDKTQNDSD